MRLRYPSPEDLKRQKVNWKNLPEIPIKLGTPSGFLILGLASSGSDAYVCFTNLEKDNVWIEKFHALQTTGMFHFEMFRQIDDKEEFALAYKFFQTMGILDGQPKNT